MVWFYFKRRTRCLSWLLWDVAFYGHKLFHSNFILALTGEEVTSLMRTTPIVFVPTKRRHPLMTCYTGGGQGHRGDSDDCGNECDVSCDICNLIGRNFYHLSID